MLGLLILHGVFPGSVLRSTSIIFIQRSTAWYGFRSAACSRPARGHIAFHLTSIILLQVSRRLVLPVPSLVSPLQCNVFSSTAHPWWKGFAFAAGIHRAVYEKDSLELFHNCGYFPTDPTHYSAASPSCGILWPFVVYFPASIQHDSFISNTFLRPSKGEVL